MNATMTADFANLSRVVLPVQLAVFGKKCSCRFLGMCTCNAATEFMDCVADAISSKLCDGNDQQFKQSCESMASVCPSVGLQCTEKQAHCEAKPALVMESVDTIEK